MGEVIVITSGKGGVGKTTLTANLGIALSQMGKSVIAIDTDIGLRNLDVVMGLENQIVYNLVDVLEGNCRLKQAVIKDRRYNNLFLLPSAQSKDKDSVTPEQMIGLTDCLKEEFDYVLIDCPAGIEQGLKQGLKQGEMLMLISMVNKKMQKGKSIEEIAEDLEEDRETIEKIANVIKENGHDINADEVYKMLKKK